MVIYDAMLSDDAIASGVKAVEAKITAAGEILRRDDWGKRKLAYTIKGKTQDVVVPATFTPQGNSGVFDGSFTIRRADFSIGEGSWAKFDIVANDVLIKFRITATSK